MFDIEKTKTEIKDVLQEGLDKNIITKSELQAMNPDDKIFGRFYCNFKVNKPHEHNTVPPERPIISQSGSMCENIAQFVELHINHIGMEHESFLQDTPDFLRTIKHLNKGNTLKSNTVLFTMDVKGLFTNIIHEEGLKALEEALNKRQNPKIETDFILKLMYIILHRNIFEFHDGYWKKMWALQWVASQCQIMQTYLWQPWTKQ